MKAINDRKQGHGGWRHKEIIPRKAGHVLYYFILFYIIVFYILFRSVQSFIKKCSLFT
jgi:hypothetical protein